MCGSEKAARSGFVSIGHSARRSSRVFRLRKLAPWTDFCETWEWYSAQIHSILILVHISLIPISLSNSLLGAEFFFRALQFLC